jgi:hypothetical protein
VKLDNYSTAHKQNTGEVRQLDKQNTGDVGWSRNRIFLFREIRNNDESDFNFAKFREISLYFILRNFAKFRINYFAKLFRYVNFSNTNTFHEISRNCFVM